MPAREIKGLDAIPPRRASDQPADPGDAKSLSANGKCNGAGVRPAEKAVRAGRSNTRAWWSPRRS